MRRELLQQNLCNLEVNKPLLSRRRIQRSRPRGQSTNRLQVLVLEAYQWILGLYFEVLLQAGVFLHNSRIGNR